MKYRKIYKRLRVFLMTEIFVDFHNEIYAGAYFQLNTPVYGCSSPEFLVFVEQPNLLIFCLSVAVEMIFYKKMNLMVFLICTIVLDCVLFLIFVGVIIRKQKLC